MKRDMEFIRELLLAIEAMDNQNCHSYQIEFPSPQDISKVNYHLHLLIDAGFIEGKPITTFGEDVPHIWIKRMLWAGHDFLDSTKNESIWQKTKELIVKKGFSMESVGFSVLTQVLASVAKKHLDLN